MTKPRAIRKLDRIRTGVDYDFEIIDDGWNLSFTMSEVGNPENRAEVVATVRRDHNNFGRVVFYGRERQGNGTGYTVLVDRLTLTTGVGPRR